MNENNAIPKSFETWLRRRRVRFPNLAYKHTNSTPKSSPNASYLLIQQQPHQHVPRPIDKTGYAARRSTRI